MKNIGPYMKVPDDYLPNMQDAYECDCETGSHELNNIAARQLNQEWPTVMAMAALIEQQRDELLRKHPQPLGLVRIGRPRSINLDVSELGLVPDIDIARKHGLAVGTVRHRRLKLGIPSFVQPHRLSRTTIKRGQEWDWSKPDAELAREHCITRERVRQIRSSLKLPSATDNRQMRITQQEQVFLNWVKENYPNGEPVVFLKAKRAGFNETTVRRLCAKHGIVRTFERTGLAESAEWSQFNWRLSNWMLTEAWGKAPNTVAAYRSAHGKERSPQIRRDRMLPGYKVALEQEKQKAAAFKLLLEKGQQ